MSMLSKIEAVEARYEVNKITFKDVQLWPYLRVYLSYSIIGKGKVEANKKLIGNAIVNLFYGFTNLFKKVDYIIFSNAEQRKLINGQYYDRCDFLSDKYKKNIFFELTSNTFHKKSNVPTKNIVSKIPLYLLAKIIKIFVNTKRVKQIEIFNNLLKEENYQLNINSLLKDYISHYFVAKILIKIYKPKALILITSYTNYPYIQAFKEKGIKVIEFQHGLINSTHLAYNYKLDINNGMFPDYLFSFGEFEKTIFNTNNYFINKKNVKPVGHFYLNYLNNNYTYDNELQSKLKGYKYSLAVSLQATYEKKLIDFIQDIAKDNLDIAFVIIPRVKQEMKFNTKNVFTFNSLNCYEIILNCNFHCTIYSTCAVESIGLNKPNILVNIDNKSEEHLSFIINENTNTKMVNNENEFIDTVKNMKVLLINDNAVNNETFKSDFAINMNKELDKIFDN